MSMGKKVTESSGTRHCYGCGKEFYVQWPLMWTYARTEGPRRKYFCSYSCVRKFDKEKGETKVGGHRKITKEQEKEAVMLALDGKDPLSFLKECGINNPQQKWYDMRSQIKAEDPETYEKLQKTATKPSGRPKKVETPEGAVNGPVTPDALYEEFGKTGYKVIKNVTIPKISKPVNYDGMMVRAVEGDFGSYHFQEINGKQWIDYDDKECANQLSMTVDQWRGFLKEVSHAAMILGVTL